MKYFEVGKIFILVFPYDSFLWLTVPLSMSRRILFFCMKSDPRMAWLLRSLIMEKFWVIVLLFNVTGTVTEPLIVIALP